MRHCRVIWITNQRVAKAGQITCGSPKLDSHPAAPPLLSDRAFRDSAYCGRAQVPQTMAVTLFATPLAAIMSRLRLPPSKRSAVAVRSVGFRDGLRDMGRCRLGS